MKPKHILIIQTAFIGDVILATSLLETIHSGLPDAKLDLLVRKGNESLFSGHPFVSSVLVWDKKNNKYRSLSGLLKEIRKIRYDCVINLQRYGATGLLTVMSKGGLTIGFDKNPFSAFFSHRFPHRFAPGTHEIDRNHQLAGPLTEAPLKKPRLYPLPSDYQSVEQFQTQPYFCIAPASVWFTKQFPAEKWAELIRWLPADHPVYLLGSAADSEFSERIEMLAASDRVLNLCGKLTMLESAALFEKAEMNFVNDSAPMHLCSAVNAPVCAVYCSTIPEFGYGPLSDKSFVIQTGSDLPCRPCGIHGHRRCPEGHFLCAWQIQMEQFSIALGKDQAE